MSQAKETLKPDICIISGDFSENYSFIVQDAVQGFHWTNSMATLHPFVAYCMIQNKLEVICICVISDHLKHDTMTVYAFQEVILPFIIQKCPTIEKVMYFSDGAASQYKNYKNMSNLCHHHEDFGVDAEWHFFATSHGKGPCDGIGGTVKRLAARASLQKTLTGQILTPTDLFSWAKTNTAGVSFFYVAKEDILALTPMLEERFQSAKALPGIRDNHCFVPQSSKKIKISRVSGDESGFTALVSKQQDETDQSNVDSRKPLSPNVFHIGNYVACIYDQNWWIGVITDNSEEYDDYKVKFMHPCGPTKYFIWPAIDDLTWVPKDHILQSITAPTCISQRGNKYTITDADNAIVTKNFKVFMKNQ